MGARREPTWRVVGIRYPRRAGPVGLALEDGKVGHEVVGGGSASAAFVAWGHDEVA